MRVLSLFDGISCGLVALKRVGVKVDSYHASEIDKHAIKISRANHEEIIHIGDVTKIDASQYKGIDLLLSGSPCQGFSFAGKQLNFNDPRSKLFWEFVRILKSTKPKYFLLENVPMKKEYLDVITEAVGVNPILINSADFSAQNRKRYYWTNIPIGSWVSSDIKLVDILEHGFVDREKSFCIDSGYFKGGNPKQYFESSRRHLAFNYSSSGRGNGVIEGRFTEAHKALTLTAQGYSARAVTGVLNDGEELTWRHLTVLECERLQTLPDGYTDKGVNQRNRYKAIGNGWTVDVIAHIFQGLK